MNDQQLRHPLPPQLPVDAEGFLAARKKERTRTLNDEVESVYLALAKDEKFRAYIYATYDEQAVEGSLSADNVFAAQMIREKAKEMEIEEVASQKVATISKALGVVARRYGFSRKERRNMLGGEIVPDNGSE